MATVNNTQCVTVSPARSLLSSSHSNSHYKDKTVVILPLYAVTAGSGHAKLVNACYPHSLLPGIEYSRHVTPWAISGAPHYRLKSIKVFSLITSRTLPKKGMHSRKYTTFLKIIHTSMTRYICALAVLFWKLRRHKQPQVRLQNIQYYCLRYNRLVCRMTPWDSVRVVRVLQCSTAGRHVISGKRRNYGMYCHVV